MRRRILLTIVAVTAFAVVGFGMPLGYAVANLYRDEAVSRLERDATKASIEVPASFRAQNDPLELPKPDDGTSLAVYDTTGSKLVGDGPATADGAVQRAVSGRVSEGTTDGALVVGVPLTSEEAVFAVVRAAMPTAVVSDRVHRVWMTMFALGLAVIGLAALVALRQASRSSCPVSELAGAAARLGNGDFALQATHSGIDEIDEAAEALELTAQRMGDVLQRERSFSAHASHQLRTPLAGLHVQLEGALLAGDDELRPEVNDALTTLEQLQTTVADLLALRRDATPSRSQLDVRALVRDAEQRWHGALAAVGRPLRVRVASSLPPVHAADVAIRQALEALLANAYEHGAGTVSVTAASINGALALDVEDEGQGVASGLDPFRAPDGQSNDRGIGLALARSLVEAEGGRLMLRRRSPRTGFRLVLPERDSEQSQEIR